MITRVSLTNFQVHRKLDLEFGKFVVCSGPSNSGKSAVLRALAALLRNDSVTDYVTYGESNLTVHLYLDDGHEVKWEKGKTKNQYTLVRPDGTESEYRKVGAGVPEEISDVLRIGPISLEDGTKAHLNLHEQQESPFLIMDTAGYVAKVFGELTSAGKLFSAANEGNRRTREEKKIKGLRQEDITAARTDLQQYEHLEEVQAKLTWATETLGTAEKIQNAISALRDLSDAHDLGMKSREESEALIARLLPVANLDLSGLEEMGNQLSSLEDLLTQHEAASKTLEGLDVFLARRKEIPDFDLEILAKLEAAIGTVEECLTASQDLRKQILQLDGVIAANERERAEVEALLSEVDTCPTCGSEITASHLLDSAHA